MFNFSQNNVKHTLSFCLHHAHSSKKEKKKVLMFSCNLLSRVISQLIIPSLSYSKAFLSVYLVLLEEPEGLQ